MKAQGLFNILATIALIVLLIPKAEVPMIKLGDRLTSYVDGTMTDLMEIEKLRQDLNRVGPVADAVGGWLPNGGNIPNFLNGFVAQRGTFEISPTYNFTKTSGAQSIPNNAETPISFFATSKSNDYLKFDAATPTKIFVRIVANRDLLVFGTVTFVQGGTGRRAMSIKQYDKDDVQIGAQTLFSFLPSNITTDVYPFCTWIGVSSQSDYIIAYLYQNNGGALNASVPQFGLSLVR